MRWRIAEVDADYDPAAQPLRLPLFEWRAAWDSGELAEFNPQAHIPPSAVDPGKTYRVRVRFKDNTDRASHWSAPVEFTASAPSIQPLRDALRITEIMYRPAGNPDAEFIEIQNIGWSRVALGDLRLAGGVRYDFAAAPLDPFLAASASNQSRHHMRIIPALQSHRELPRGRRLCRGYRFSPPRQAQIPRPEYRPGVRARA